MPDHDGGDARLLRRQFQASRGGQAGRLHGFDQGDADRRTAHDLQPRTQRVGEGAGMNDEHIVRLYAECREPWRISIANFTHSLVLTYPNDVLRPLLTLLRADLDRQRQRKSCRGPRLAARTDSLLQQPWHLQRNRA